MSENQDKHEQSPKMSPTDIGPALYLFGPPPEKWVEYGDIREYLISLRKALGATTISSEPTHAENVGVHIFQFLFNTFKSILLILDEQFSESGNILYRNLWETSLSLHWIANDYPNRVSEFLNYSSVEFRSVVKSMGDKDAIELYDSATANFQEKYTKTNVKSGKRTLSDNFTNKSIYDRSQELGAPWIDEYQMVYKLTSMYAHGAPAVIIHSIKQATFKCNETEDNNQCSLIAVMCARLMARNVNTLEAMGILETTESVSLPLVGLELFLQEFELNKNKTNNSNKS